MTRTPLAGALAGLVGDVAHEEGSLPRITRRGFLAGTAAAAVAAAMGPLPAQGPRGILETLADPSAGLPQAGLKISDAEASRMTLTLTPQNPEQHGAPAEIRFYGLARAATELSFEFTDLPMP